MKRFFSILLCFLGSSVCASNTSRGIFFDPYEAFDAEQIKTEIAFWNRKLDHVLGKRCPQCFTAKQQEGFIRSRNRSLEFIMNHMSIVTKEFHALPPELKGDFQLWWNQYPVRK